MSEAPRLALPAPTELLPFDGERFVSGLSGEIAHEHYLRYLFAAQFCTGKRVLDVASGEGYGSAILARHAAEVCGVDLSPDAVGFASRTYAGAHIRFLQGDIRALPLPDASFDVVVSFETLEHVEEHEVFLAEIRRVLCPGGLLVISSPDRDVYLAGLPPNPYHRRETNRNEFVALLRPFGHCMLGAERAITGAAILPGEGASGLALETFDVLPNGTVERQQGLARATYLIAVASDAPLPDVTWAVLNEGGYIPHIREAAETGLRALMHEGGQLRDAVQAANDAAAAAAAAWACEREALVADRDRLRTELAVQRVRTVDLDRLQSDLDAERAHTEALMQQHAQALRAQRSDLLGTIHAMLA